MAKLVEITGRALAGEWGTDDEKGNGIPVLRTTNFTNEGTVDYTNVVTRTITKERIEEKYLRHGDILIEKSGGSDKQPVGRVIYFNGPEKTYLFNNFTGLLRVKNQEKWFPKYVFYSLYVNYQRGGTRVFENKTTGLHNLKIENYVSQYEIKERSFKEQREICRILDKLYSIIETCKEEMVKLDDLIKARFVEMFGDPEYNNFHWKIEKMEKICDVGSSKRLYQKELVTEGIPFLRISDLIDKIDTGIFSCDYFISEKKYKELKDQKLVPKRGDILVTTRGTLGRCYIISADDKFYFQDGMITWLSKLDSRIEPLYISHLFLMSGFRKQIDRLQAGSTVSYLSISMTKKLEIMIPPIKLQNQFVTFVSKVDKSKAAVNRSLEKLEILKKSLMQRYFG